MENKVWWQQEEVWKKVFKASMVVLLIAVAFACHRVISTNRSSANLLSDSTRIANGIVGQRLKIDTAQIPWSTALSAAAIDNKVTINKLYQLHHQNDMETYWLGRKGPTKYYYELVRVFKSADELGLQSSLYDLRYIEQELKKIYGGERDDLAIVALDFQISEKFFQFGSHLTDGRIKRAGFGKSLWKIEPMPDVHKDVMALTEVKKPEHLWKAIEQLKPQNEQYARLEKAYQYYLELDRKTSRSFRKISINRKIKPNDRHEAIPSIRRRVALHDPETSEPSADSLATDSLLYDTRLTDAIKNFQLRHGLTPDGVIGGKTVMFLNQSFRDKAALIAVNMERLRWTHETLSENYIVVNIPEYALRVYDNNKESLKLKVVVGDPETPTPVFSDVLEHIVFSPTWTIPKSIIEEEVIPRLQEDPDYYTDSNYTFMKKDDKSEVDPLDEKWDEEVDPNEYVIVQKPGSDNALGRVKFVMPNNLNIYLHDTPQKRLFNLNYRAFSHGCIRVHEPVQLAKHLLRDNDKWDDRKMQEAMDQEEPKTVMLKKHYVVHLQYQTAWVDDDGVVHFRDDIYGHDKHQLKQLYAAPSNT